MVKFLMMVIPALLMSLTIGCGDRAAQVQQNSATSQGGANDGTGGGTTDEDGVVIDVDYGEFVNEENLGLPTNPAEAHRKTKIQLALQVPFTAIKSKYPGASYGGTFQPDIHRSFKISDDKLNVTLSDGSSLPFVLYLHAFWTPKKQDGKVVRMLDFAALATLDNIAYSTIRLNQSHTAYYVKAALSSNKNFFITSNVWNSDKLTVTKYNTIPEMWHGGRIRLTETSTTFPATTKQPCFQNFLSCVNSTKLIKAEILFQPIATVGYQNHDWFEYVFKDEELKKYTATSTTAPPDELMRLAKKETIHILKLDKKENSNANVKDDIVQKNDIGWLGLTEEKRNKILRFHTVELEIKLTKVDSSDNNNVEILIPENSMKLIDYTIGEGKDTTPKSIGNKKKRIKYVQDNPTGQ